MTSTDTLISVTNDILRATGQRADKTDFAETDSTSYLRDRINEALQTIYGLQPFIIDADGTITITPSTRTFSGPSATPLTNIHTNTLRLNQAIGDIPLEYVTEEFIIRAFPDFETIEADFPRYVYFTNGLIGVYPLLKSGDANLTLEFKYSTQFVKLTDKAATFPFENRSVELEYVKLYAQMRYEIFKGFGQPAETGQEANKALTVLKVRALKNKRVGFTGYRRLC